MGREITATASVTPMWRRNAKGDLIKIEEPNRDEYATPPQGTRARFVLSGVSDTFEMSGEYGTSTNVRIEYLIEKTSGAGLEHLNGKRFTDLFTWKVSAKSNLGRLLGALRGRPIEPGEVIDIDAFIGTTFVSSTTMNEKGYAGLSIEAIDPSKTRLSPYVTMSPNGHAPQAAAANGDESEDDNDPFEGADDDEDL